MILLVGFSGHFSFPVSRTSERLEHFTITELQDVNIAYICIHVRAVHLLVIPLVLGVDTMCALDAFRPRSRSTSASSRSKPARTGQSANLSENWDAPIHGNFRLGKMLTLW